jgi:YidC/Oxa1 family membrane protein insertase
MFTTFIVKPIFNLLVFIYAIIPGHNFGLALIIFTVLIRFLMWPLVKKQLKQTKLMRKIQPEIKKIKAQTKGNKQQESQLLMSLYKEQGINPLSTFPILIIQLVILLGLYSGLNGVIHNPHNLVTFTYPFIKNLSWIKTLSGNIHLFDDTLLGIVNLGKSALGSKSGIYWPAMIIVFGSAVAQYYQSKQLIPSAKNQKSIKTILKEASSGKQADQSEVNAAVSKTTRYLLPVMIFIFTVDLASALSLYWLVSGLVAYGQQAYILREDEEEMEEIGDESNKKTKKTKDLSKIPEAQLVEVSPKSTIKKTTTTKKSIDTKLKNKNNWQKNSKKKRKRS